MAYMRYMKTKTTFPPLQGYETTLIDYEVKVIQFRDIKKLFHTYFQIIFN